MSDHVVFADSADSSVKINKLEEHLKSLESEFPCDSFAKEKNQQKEGKWKIQQKSLLSRNASFVI